MLTEITKPDVMLTNGQINRHALWLKAQGK